MLTSYELWEKVLACGIEYNCHASDLYLPVNDQTIKLISEYQFKQNVTRFRSNLDKTFWYDIPFAYYPFWERVEKIVAAPPNNHHRQRRPV